MSHAVESKWFALHVRSRHEKMVFAQLEAKLQDVFLPLYTIQNKWADRSKQVSLPLFPGYVFCSFNPAMRSTVVTTSGVIDVVRMGPDPAPIENSEIDALKLIVSSGIPAKPCPHLVAGQQVMIVEGPLAGVSGILTSFRNSCRLVVSVDLLCRSVAVEIDRDCIVPHELPGPAYYPATL